MRPRHTHGDASYRAADSIAAGIYARSGIGSRVGFGERAAILVIDLQNGFTDPASPVGADLSPVLGATARLLAVARGLHVPVAYTAVGFDASHRDGTTWLAKMPGLAALVEGTRWCDVDDRVAPRDDEPVWIKRAPSGFFGTPAVTYLVAERIDTVIVVGCVTSGCVRATVVDSVSYGFRTIVPLECVGDRSAGVHDAALFDIDAKYGDVEPLEDVIDHLSAIGATGQPPGSATR